MHVVQDVTFLFLFIANPANLCSCNAVDARLPKAETNKVKSKVVKEMLIPRYSTTVLMCEPVFTATNTQAQWYHDGMVVASVSSVSNAVLHNGTYNREEAIPDVGFLIITNISLEDEGNYWCRRTDNQQKGEVAKIVVAYVELFPNNSQLTFHPSLAYFGQDVTADCPETKAFPPPIHTWFLNGKAVDLSNKRIVQDSNGSLQIHQFSRQDIGVYECVARNFAGRTSVKAYMYAIPHVSGDVFDGAIFASVCQSILQHKLLWLLFSGCLAISGSLSCLVCALLPGRASYRYGTLLYPSPSFQTRPNFLFGFQKAVVSVADAHINA